MKTSRQSSSFLAELIDFFNAVIITGFMNYLK